MRAIMTDEYARLSFRAGFLIARIDQHLGAPTLFAGLAHMKAWDVTPKFLEEIKAEALRLEVPAQVIEDGEHDVAELLGELRWNAVQEHNQAVDHGNRHAEQCWRNSDQLLALELSIEELELSMRAYNCLKNSNIQTVGDLVQKTEHQLMLKKNMGRVSVAEVKALLATMGLSLNDAVCPICGKK